MRSLLFACFALSLLVSAAFSKPDRAPPNKNGADWPQWRGSARDGICTDTGLLKEWPKDGPKLLWDAKKVNGGSSVGSGMSSLAIVQGKIFTMGHVKGQVSAFCINADTGKEIWNTKLANAGGNEPRSTPTVDGEHVYVLSQQGKLFCLKTADGAVVWQKDIFKEFNMVDNRRPGFGGYAESVTIDGDHLICAPGGKTCMVALNKRSGDTYWTCPSPKNDGTGFGSIVKADVAGVKMYITLCHNQLGLIGVEAETGKFLWNYAKVANGTANIPTAIVKGDFVFTSTGYGTGAALLKLVPDGKKGIKVEEQYFLKGGKLQNHHGGMIMLGDYIYGGHGHNEGLPFCLEWKTGKLVWGPERGPGGRSAAVLFADGNLYFRYESGVMALIEAAPTAYKVKGAFTPPLSTPGWQHPVIYHGRLYLRGNDQILCYDIKQ
ncbi:MAG: PQQ-binding-like beta-propeller repeat protein [Planctomycetes bacterium]|nr:PQQ-binding-like beta-propeller repeat protein [Planctomycetota bacterium]